MSKAFLDTTIVVDVLLNPPPQHTRARAAIEQYSETEVPEYAFKELRQGPLAYFRWFHNKISTTGSLADGIEALRSISQWQKYRLAGALTALETAMTNLRSVNLGSAVKEFGSKVNLDEVTARYVTAQLRNAVFLAWSKRETVATRVVIPCSCLAKSGPQLADGLLVLAPSGCVVKGECAMGPALKADPEALKKLRAASEAQKSTEGTRRAKVLRELIRKPANQLSNKDCRALGDAVFAFFAPLSSEILTTNMRDHEPLASAVGKVAKAPK